jgi:hypothetical protein
MAFRSKLVVFLNTFVSEPTLDKDQAFLVEAVTGPNFLNVRLWQIWKIPYLSEQFVNFFSV